MNYTVFEGKQPVGELTIEPQGLYYEIKARITPVGSVRRVYGIRGTECSYIGIPDRNGELFHRISRKNFIIPERVILSDLSPDRFRFIADSHEVHQDTKERENEKRETVVSSPLIQEDPENHRQPPLIEIDNGGEEYEVHTQNFGNDIDPLLLADLPADYDYGGPGTEETDRNNL